MIIDTQTITANGGDYRIEFLVDETADHPYNEGFSLLTAGSRYQMAVDHISEVDSDADVLCNVTAALKVHSGGDHWDREYRSGAAIVRYLKLTGHHGATLVDDAYRPVDASTDRFDRVYGVAWAPADATDPTEYTTISLAQWESWADGDVFGWRLLDPQGEEIDACWGYYGFYHSLLGDSERAYIVDQAIESARSDANDRVQRANLVGAGFVDII